MRKSVTKALLGGVGATIITVCMAVSSWSMTDPADPAAETLRVVPVELGTSVSKAWLSNGK